jgi:hypothetical protein
MSTLVRKPFTELLEVLETVVGWYSVSMLCEQTLLMERTSRVE